ncbi:MAG TPA: Gfo/Idh/MocA family oxidoreductase [Bacteroidales bacterium]|nr:Gfo/Idh/MocA family oxidoreductase [Bacteroidales bacterium]
MSESRRNFIRKTTAASAGLALGGILPSFSSKSYARIIGSNEKILVSVMGVNSRGKALATSFAQQENCEVVHICDVDNRAIETCLGELAKHNTNYERKGFRDFRESLQSKDIDALVIAAPDHWHAPAALLAMQAGKNVYVEKPCSHNPNEGEILVQAASKYGKAIQMGNQRRSFPNVILGIQELKNGIIGRPYFGRGWYTNNRGSMGVGKETPVPEWLNWDLWQGPAPRQPYRDNLVHYNWHWLWHWGTGEALNNGTHMVDLLRWGLGVDYPVKVSSNGGRYRFKDDWETPDTQIITLDFKEGVTLSWEGRSCNGRSVDGSTAGAIFYGDKGSVLFPGGNNYRIFDLEGNVVKDVKAEQTTENRNLSNPSEFLDFHHIRNFFDGIRNGSKVLNAYIDSGHKSTLLVQLGNIAQRVGHSLETDPSNGHILKDRKAQQYWSRTYEKGWEMKI